MRIFGWQADQAGCGYYRIQLPFDQLDAMGHEVAYGERLPAELHWAGAVDVLVGQRVCLDGPTSIWQALARKGRSLMVYETDDDLLDVDASNATAHQFYDRRKQANIRANLAVADLITVSTIHLAEVASRYTSAPVVVLPNCVPRWLTEHEPDRREDVVTVGWGGGSSHALDWAEAAPYLRRFVERTDGVELHVMGERYGSGWRNVRHSGWTRPVDAYLRSIDYHIGLAPLRPSVFNRSKSCLKAMEYAALGIPAVVSDAGPYPGFVRDGETGLIVRRPHEWATALRTLVGDRELRERMGATGRAMVRAACTIEGNAWRWAETFEQALTGRVAA